jgi:poly-gamma-glutamate synthesis protein (capsule biosynthesis protein)
MPSPTPTPVWPVVLYLAPELPADARIVLDEVVAQHTDRFALTTDPTLADVRVELGTSDGEVVGEWFYALAAPFPALDDGVAWADVVAAWRGEPAGEGFAFAARAPLMDAETQVALTAFLGPPGDDALSILPADQLIDAAWADRPSWAIVPFHRLEPRWKVLRVDGQSVLTRGMQADVYPLRVPIAAAGLDRGVLALREFLGDELTNRDEGRMTVLVMTGVTALTRGTARTMEEQGVIYPAQDIGDWLRGADLTHVSNEVSFTPNCPVPPVQGGMVFCSHDRYIELLEAVDVEIVELTGNHLSDYGTEPLIHSLQMFQERGWRWFGGGTDLAEATRPLTVTLESNRLAFVGCNSFGPENAWAMEDSPGAAPCDWGALRAQVTNLRASGWLPIATVQGYETYEYFPTPQQAMDFQALAEAGAVVVQGSQAHQPQGFGFHGGGFIHYGLGNLFFDQMQSLGTRQEFLDRHVFYDGRHISVELLTAMLEEYARPRPMTGEERRALLEAVFAASDWAEE